MGSCCRETGGRGAETYRSGDIHADFYAHQRQRIRAVTPVVRGFKVDSDVGGRVGVCRVSGSKLSGKELQQNFL